MDYFKFPFPSQTDHEKNDLFKQNNLRKIIM